MASLVTVVSRFCYRSPTRPLFVAGLIFLILITWKFLVTQPDAHALMMHSKPDKTWLSGRKQVRPQQLHAPLQSPVNDARKRLVNKLPDREDLEEPDKRENVDDSGGKLEREVEGETQDGGRNINLPAPNAKQTELYFNSNSKKKESSRKEGNRELVIEKGGLNEGKTAEGNSNKRSKGNGILNVDRKQEQMEVDINQSEHSNEKRKGKQTIASGKRGQSEDLIGSEREEMLDNRFKEGGGKNKEEKQTSGSINHVASHPSGERERSSPSNINLNTKHKTLVNQIKTKNTAEYDFPVGQYNILLTLVKMSPNSPLSQSMNKFLKSVCRHTSIKLTVHAVVDDIGKMVVEEFFKGATGLCKETQVVIHDVNKLIDQLKPLTKVLQGFFSSDDHSYYNDPIFFMSTALHKVFPKKLKQVIMLDVDLRFVSDIKPLFNMFNNFKDTNIMGLAREQSPVYRHIFYKYRMAHKDTLIGDPPPNGIPGFNSGVVLFNLENMRKSSVYNHILEGQPIKSLSEKYDFRGHLGDQDFFTLLSAEFPELFYIVPCSWNRQLCQWWRENGYADVFDLYYNCSEPVHVYHGNCRTPIPVDD
ncbi:hypothetical protein QZH41_017790 [Actinostola sp. cb2023]|nr:hypothetical protein QZH41_017790 [Actinostola sp. cb2023]